jgi:hypothetical protein
VTVWADCKVTLVAELPLQLKHEEVDEPLVYIATVPSESVANMWSGILAEHGIHCPLKSANLRAAMYCSTCNMTCQIHVLASQAEQAREILSPLLKVDTGE